MNLTTLSCIVAVVLSLSQLGPFGTALGQPSEAPEISMPLEDGELDGLKVRSMTKRGWIVGYEDEERRPLFSPGIHQHIEIEDHEGLAVFAEFDNEKDAQQAAKLYMQDVSVVFQKGVWEDAENDSIGDEVWHTIYGYSGSLLIRSESTIILVDIKFNYGLIPEEDRGEFHKIGRSLDEQKAFQFEKGTIVRQLAERVAVHLVEKAKAGARVPVLAD